MTEYVFKIQMGRLFGVYGEKSYPSARLDVIWRKVKDCDGDEFSNYIDRLIGTERYAPLADKFEEFARSAKQSTSQEIKCKTCEDSGKVLALRLEDETKFAFRCPICKPDGQYKTNPDSKITRLPVWSNFYEGEYKRLI